MNKKAIVLLSGGLDSAVTLSIAKSRGFECFCLIFDYGQRHKKEIECAKRIALAADCRFQLLKIKLPQKGSSLIDKKMILPAPASNIPSTYVPARNIIFLSFAFSYAEAIKAGAIYIGAHCQDYSGYPDCRPEFFRAFSKAILAGTKSGVEKNEIKLITPLIHKTKSQIIRLGESAGVNFKLTWSCYQGGRYPCGKCDSCYYRIKGFKEAKLKDPAIK